MRQKIASQLARQLGVIVSKRVSPPLAIVGQPGIGKSQLAQSLLEHIPCHQLRVAATIGFADLAHGLPRARALPAWANAQLELLERGEHVETGILTQVVATTLAASAPFVLCFEDIHEADPERSNWITALASALAQMRGVGLIATSRTMLPEPFQNHRLEPLSPVETARLLEAELRAVAPDQALDWVFARTRGNPLFTLEYSRYLRRQGYFWSDGERWHWREPPEGYMPLTIEALILKIVSSAAEMPQARVALEVRSVLPTGLEPERLESLWARVAGLEPDALDGIRRDLERTGLLRGYDFAHPLFGEVIAHDLPALRRYQYARESIKALDQDHPELVVALIQDAGFGPSDALELLSRAVERVRQTGTAAQVGALLGLAAEQAEGPERVRLALEATTTLEPSNAHGQIARFARLALDAQPDHREARLKLAGALASLGRFEEVQTLVLALPEAERHELRWVRCVFHALSQGTRYTEALEVWREHPELATQQHSVFSAASAYANSNAFEAAETLINLGLGLPDLDETDQAEFLGLLACIRSEQGRLEEAQVLHDQSLERFVRSASISGQAVTHYNRTFNQYRLGRYGAAIDDLKRAIAGYDQIGSAYYSTNAQAVLGEILVRMGRFEEAEEVLLRSFEMLDRRELTHGLVSNEWKLAEVYAEWRPPHGAALAQKFSRLAVNHARQLANGRCLLTALNVAARIEAWQGQPELALKLIHEASENLIEGNLEDECQYRLTLAMVLEANGQPNEAGEHWQKLMHEAPTAEIRFEAELEVARLGQDHRRVQELIGWFEDQGLGALALRGQRHRSAWEVAPAPASPPSSRINVLGPVTLERDGQPVPTRAQKRLEILAYLLETRIAGRNEASTLDLLDALYPGESELEARNTLKQQVYLIRSSLGPDSIVSTPSGYALGKVGSDAEEVLSSDQTALWRGPYLGGIGNGWYAGVTDALSLRLRSSITALMESDPIEAARLGTILLEMEPYDADALRLAVQALEAAGNPKAARRTLEAGRARLAEIGMAFDEASPSPNAA